MIIDDQRLIEDYIPIEAISNEALQKDQSARGKFLLYTCDGPDGHLHPYFYDQPFVRSYNNKGN